MKQGKHICETLKSIRSEIANANDIDYSPTECTHEGDCAGTCPKCESETRWLERQLRARQAMGKAVTIAGFSVALGTMSSCHNIFQPNGYLEPNPPESTQTTVVNNSNNKASLVAKNDSTGSQEWQLMGDVECPPDSKAPKKKTKK